MNKNMEHAVYCYRESSNLGHPGASVNLSNCYDSGDGVAEDKSMVFKLDTFAANLGHPIGINNLGCCYLFGKGCAVSHMRKVKAWREASDMGYPTASVNLGNVFLFSLASLHTSV